jgi:phasin family protein
MSTKSSQPFNQALGANQSTYEAIQRLTEIQFKTLQQLADVRGNQINQAMEAMRDQMQLISKMGDPGQLASSQAELAKRSGQQYVENVNEAIRIVSKAWEQYGAELEKSMNAAMDGVRKAAESAMRQVQKNTNAAADRAEKSASPK